jgi:hypothetical protein
MYIDPQIARGDRPDNVIFCIWRRETETAFLDDHLAESRRLHMCKTLRGMVGRGQSNRAEDFAHDPCHGVDGVPSTITRGIRLSSPVKACLVAVSRTPVCVNQTSRNDPTADVQSKPQRAP